MKAELLEKAIEITGRLKKETDRLNDLQKVKKELAESSYKTLSLNTRNNGVNLLIDPIADIVLTIIEASINDNIKAIQAEFDKL